MQQGGFDFSGMRDDLGAQYEDFCNRWNELQEMLSARGHQIVPMGRILAGMVERYGIDHVRQACTLSKAPGWRRANTLMQCYEWLQGFEMTDAQAAVLDSIVDRKMSRQLRQKCLEMMKRGSSVESIEDFIDTVEPTPRPAPPPTVTEAEVRDAYLRSLRDQGWHARPEQETEDGGKVDIVATRDGETVIVECKVDLTRSSAYDAIGQLTVYSRTFNTRNWHLAYWHDEESSEGIQRVCGSDIRFVRVAIGDHQKAAA